jgi:hypothetical protein
MKTQIDEEIGKNNQGQKNKQHEKKIIPVCLLFVFLKG